MSSEWAMEKANEIESSWKPHNFKVVIAEALDAARAQGRREALALGAEAMTILKTSLTLLAVAVLVWMAYRIGQQVERRRAAPTACENAITANASPGLAMICEENTLFVWSKETGQFVGAINFDKAVTR